MRECRDCIHHSIVTRYDRTDHDRAYDLARCDLTGEETDDIPDPCDEWAGDVDSMQAHIDGLQDELRHVEAIRHQYAAELDAYDETHMKLPLDMNGETIRIGDTVRELGDKVPMKVMSLTFYEDCVDVNICGMNPNLLMHAKPRTIEDVLDRMRYELLGIWAHALDDDMPDMEDEVIARYADKLRELMEVGE